MARSTASLALPVADAPPVPAYYDTPRLSLLALLPDRPVREALEIGCGAGANLVELRRRQPGCRTTGVELHAPAAAVAARRPEIDDVRHGDALDPALALGAGRMDLIILSHVLEHFADPAALLARCLHWLAPDGQMLIALPNVRHHGVLLPLVFGGEFRYREDGVLDRTHLRFFTRRSAVRLLQEHGLRIERMQADIEGRRSRWLDRGSAGLLRDFAAFAYNFRVSRA